MDSGNSGSLQSSSGGDEEYDSRAADSIFMHFHPRPHVGSVSNLPPPQRPTLPPLFDPLSGYMQLPDNSNSLLLNPSISWQGSTSIRSRPNPSASHDAIINPLLSIPSFQTPSAAAPNQNHTAARNPKKRPRASRRAPTTVLTTDTSNFRAMVQEFTGIPAQPFSNSSFSGSRLDLFGTRSPSFEAGQPPPPPYLRRPFAQKIQSPPPFLASSTSIDAIAASSTANISSVSSLPITQSSNLFNIQNPLLTSLLQSNPKFLFSNSPAMASKPHYQNSFEVASNDIKNGGLEEFVASDGNRVSAALSGLPNLISPDQIVAQTDRNHSNTNERNAESWKNNGLNLHEEDDYQGRLKRINGGYGFATNGKMNYPAPSSSSFHGEKGPENIAATTRGEGMVESWICSSE